MNVNVANQSATKSKRKPLLFVSLRSVYVSLTLLGMCSATPTFAFDDNQSIATSSASGVRFEVTDNLEQIKVNVDTCYPGRAAKARLQMLVPTLAANDIKQRYQHWFNVVSSHVGINTQQTNTQLFLLQQRLKQTSFEHQYSQIGNETCTAASATVNNIGASNANAAQLNLDQLVPFGVPQHLYFIGTQSEFLTEITARLAEQKLTFDTDWLQASMTTIDTINSDHSEPLSYIHVDIDKYKQMAFAQYKRVFLLGDSAYHSTIVKYFTNKGLEITKQQQDAYWIIKPTLTIEALNPSANQVKLSIVADADSNQIQFDNTPSQLPLSNNPTDSSISKAILVHLELMDVANKLTSSRY